MEKNLTYMSILLRKSHFSSKNLTLKDDKGGFKAVWRLKRDTTAISEKFKKF